jgi:hypothetical protein
MFYFIFQETGSKSLRCYHCPQTFVDMKSLHIHIFVDHQNTKINSIQGPPNKVVAQPSPNALPLAPPSHPQAHLQAHPGPMPVRQVQPLPNNRPPEHLLNGHHFQQTASAASNEALYRRQTSSSSGGSDFSESSRPNLEGQQQQLQPQSSLGPKNAFSCDLCGMSGIPDRTAFQQVTTPGDFISEE